MQKLLIIGNLGADPDIRHTSNGDVVANFPVASTTRWKDKNGEKQERTEWFRCVAFRRLGEIVAEFLTTGSRVYIEGELSTSKWTDNDGNNHWSTQVIVKEMQMLSRKNENGQQQERGAPPPQQRNRQPQQYQPEPNQFEDDIPF